MSQEGDARDPLGAGPSTSGREALGAGPSTPGREALGAGRDSAHVREVSVVDVPIEDVTIFSPTSVEVVFQWWLESNRRWAERNRLKTPAA